MLVLQAGENLGMELWQRKVYDLLCPVTSHSLSGLHLKCWNPMVGQCMKTLNYCMLNFVSSLGTQNYNFTCCFV